MLTRSACSRCRKVAVMPRGGGAGGGPPSLDHAESHSAGPLLARHEIVVFGFENLRRRYGSREGGPPPTPPPLSLASVTRFASDRNPTQTVHPPRTIFGWVEDHQSWMESKQVARGHARRMRGAGGDLPGPVSSGEPLNAASQHLVAGPECPRGLRLSVVREGHPPPPSSATPRRLRRGLRLSVVREGHPPPPRPPRARRDYVFGAASNRCLRRKRRN